MPRFVIVRGRSERGPESRRLTARASARTVRPREMVTRGEQQRAAACRDRGGQTSDRGGADLHRAGSHCRSAPSFRVRPLCGAQGSDLHRAGSDLQHHRAGSDLRRASLEWCGVRPPVCAHRAGVRPSACTYRESIYRAGSDLHRAHHRSRGESAVRGQTSSVHPAGSDLRTLRGQTSSLHPLNGAGSDLQSALIARGSDLQRALIASLRCGVRPPARSKPPRSSPVPRHRVSASSPAR